MSPIFRMTDVERTEKLGKIREDRLRRHGRPVLDENRVARDVIASLRLAGVDATPWISVPNHLIVHEVIGTYTLSADQMYLEHGSTANRGTDHVVAAGVYPVVLMSRRDRAWERFIRVLMPTTSSVYTGPQGTIDRGPSPYFLVRYDYQYAAMVESGVFVLTSGWAVRSTWREFSRWLFEGSRVVGQESYDHRALEFTKDGRKVTLQS